jgi:hypothetical protein
MYSPGSGVIDERPHVTSTVNYSIRPFPLCIQDVDQERNLGKGPADLLLWHTSLEFRWLVASFRPHFVRILVRTPRTQIYH